MNTLVFAGSVNKESINIPVFDSSLNLSVDRFTVYNTLGNDCFTTRPGMVFLIIKPVDDGHVSCFLNNNRLDGRILSHAIFKYNYFFKSSGKPSVIPVLNPVNQVKLTFILKDELGRDLVFSPNTILSVKINRF